MAAHNAQPQCPVQDEGIAKLLRWARYRRENNSPPRGWLMDKLRPTSADYDDAFPMNSVDWKALAQPPGLVLTWNYCLSCWKHTLSPRAAPTPTSFAAKKYCCPYILTDACRTS